MRVLSIKEPDADRTDRSAGPDHQRPAGHAGGSANRQIALINLRNIRSVLARHDLTP